MRLLAIVTVALVVLLAPTARAASVRAPVDMAIPPWTALGRVQTELGTR